jgi:outer membrane receptor protein involved in Fe transport
MNSTLKNKQDDHANMLWRVLLGTSAIAGVMIMSACSAYAEEAEEKIPQAVEITTAAAGAGQDSAEIDTNDPEVVVVVGRPAIYANNSTDNVMIAQESSAASVLSVIDNLTGVFVGEGGTFGSDDWSTTISMRGFNVGLSEQQIGMTIDGLPNGNSNYGGGSKANRYIDFENLGVQKYHKGRPIFHHRHTKHLVVRLILLPITLMRKHDFVPVLV